MPSGSTCGQLVEPILRVCSWLQSSVGQGQDSLAVTTTHELLRIVVIDAASFKARTDGTNKLMLEGGR